MSTKNTTRSTILVQALEVLVESPGPLHYEAIAERIAWRPEAGAKTKGSYTVYAYLYENHLAPKSEGGQLISFLRSGVFGLQSKKYTAEQIGAAKPARKSRATPEGHRQAFIPETLTEKQLEMLKKLGVQIG